MDSEILAGIAEVAECGPGQANAYMGAGYRLLDIMFGNQLRPVPADAKGVAYSHWVQRRAVYIVGRPDGVARYEPPRRERSDRANNGHPAPAAAAAGGDA